MSPFSYRPFWFHEADGDPNQPQQDPAQQAGDQQVQVQQQEVQQPPQQPDLNAAPPDDQQQADPNQPQAAGYDDESGMDDQQAMAQPAPNNVDNPAKEIDRQIFDSLSPQEQQIKTLKLKELYSDLYDSIEQIIKKYDTLGVSFEEYSEPILKSLNSLYELKDMISTHILYLFDSKTYIENDIMFNRYLTVLNTIKNATDELCKIKAGDIKDAQVLK